MQLNNLKPAAGSRKSGKRVGRGIGSGLGKTAGRGHNGFHKVGFEGGQMPLQRRLPKVGFNSRGAKYSAEVRLNELAKIEGDVIGLEQLIAANIVPAITRKAKVILSGEISKAVTLKGVAATKGAKAAIEAAGGKIED